MALGTVTFDSNAKRRCQLLSGVTALNGQPALATDGVPVYPTESVYSSATGVCDATRASREATLFVKGAASGGTASVTLRLWGYDNQLDEWVPVGTGADTTKGTLNAGAAMGATKTNKVLHSEPLLLAGHFDRLYVEVVAVSGTGMAVDVYVVVPRSITY